MATASPIDIGTVHADLDEEIIQKRFAHKSRSEVLVHSALRVSWDNFTKEMVKTQPHILHLVAHGTMTSILFERNGESEYIAYSQLYNFLNDLEDLRMVFLNLCDSKHILKDQKGLLNLPQYIPSPKRIWGLLVTRTVISPSAALTFTKTFYTALASGYSLAYAVGSARVNLAGVSKGKSVSSQWCIPVMYLARDARFFSLSSSHWAKGGSQGIQPEQIAKLKQAVEQAIERISQTRKIVNDDRELNPRLLQREQDECFSQSSSLISEVEKDLGNIDYSAETTGWINTAGRLASDAQRSFDRVVVSIQHLVRAIEDRDTRAIAYRTYAVRAALESIDQACEKGETLNIHFEQFLIHFST